MSSNIIKLCFFSFLLTGFSFPAGNASFAQDTTDPCAMSNVTFEEGEEIVYKLYYKMGPMWLAAGEVVFKVEDEGAEYHISAVGTTYAAYEWFFEVDDYYDTYVDKNTLLPNTSIRDVSEGNYKLYDKVTFDKENNVATSLRGKTKEKAVPSDYMVESCLHDVLSCLYYTRNINLDNFNPGESFPLNVFMDKETYNLDVNYLGKEENKKIHGLGRFNVMKFSPELIAGDVFKEGDEMTVYVSDDANRVPLMINTPVSIGSVRVVLKSYKGLKYDLASKIK